MPRSPRTLAWSPPTDLYEVAGAVVVRVELAGLQPGDFTITVDKRHLSIQGVRTDTQEEREYHQLEINIGEFLIELEIPSPVEIEKIAAEYSEGFLKIVLPKSVPQRVRMSK